MNSVRFAGLAFGALLAFAGCSHDRPPSREPAYTTSEPEEEPPETTPEKEESAAEKEAESKQRPARPPLAEYGIKIEGKPGFIKSPHDPQGRPIDARNVPPGIEIEDPYTPGRTLLVP